MSFSRHPSKPVPRLEHKGLQLGVGSAPHIDHELIRVHRLLARAQALGDAAALQDAEDIERALTNPGPAIQHCSRFPRLSSRIEQSGLRQLRVIAVALYAEGVWNGRQEVQRRG